MKFSLPCFALLVLLTIVAPGAVGLAAAPDSDGPKTHPPQRPLPTASQRPLGDGPARFVDPQRGDDANLGERNTPWKTLRHALRRLDPGDTLYLRGGVYYERMALRRSGNEGAPITIRSFPGELAVIDGGLREFQEAPETSWQPLADGAPGEYVSTRTYFDLDERSPPHQFLPAAWEPMWGIEEERPLALGYFTSMVPLHSYRLAVDLRSTNERWIGGKNAMRDTGIYCGPGLWFNRDTGRIHIRLAPHRLEGLGDRAYRGETDPRKLALIIAAGFGQDVLRINGVRHVRIQDLVVRGGTGSPLVHVYGAAHIELDHVSLFGGFPALLVNATQDLRVTHSAVRGLAAPWTSRAHMKYRGTASYQVILQNDQPRNEDIELAWCEFTDDHDFAFLRFAKNLRFHHNLVDNFNDDGLECGPKLRDHTLYIYQNRIGRCLIPITQHEIEKDESPLDHAPQAGVFIYRNVFDMRGGVYSAPPVEPDPTGKYLAGEGHLAGDHGSPVWPVLRVYHNTLLRDSPVFRDYHLFGLGAMGLRQNERDVFNNIFVQMDRVPGANLGGVTPETRLREGGNILWGVQQGPQYSGDLFTKFRASPLFEQSRKSYEPGWTTQDRVTDPKFLRLTPGDPTATDLRVQAGSPAIDSGVNLPPEWPDPLRDADAGAPDIGALPNGVEPWGIGVDGRLKLSVPGAAP